MLWRKWTEVWWREAGGGPHSEKVSLRRGSRSETQRSESWGKLGKENPRQKEQQVQKPRDREGSDTYEKKEARELSGESKEERSVSCTGEGVRAHSGHSQGMRALGSYSESKLLLLFLYPMVMWEILHWVQFKTEAQIHVQLPHLQESRPQRSYLRRLILRLLSLSA